MRVLVVNAGSSSLKLRLLGPDDEPLAERDLPPVDHAGTKDDVRRFLDDAGGVDAVGHRVVHGGSEFRESVLLDDPVLTRLRKVSELAPLHNPPALSAVDLARALLSQVPHVACFDTAFHATIPEGAAVYAIPREWTEERGVRRYGFHGLSHAYAAGRAAELLGRLPEGLRVVTCHLGAGASLAAVSSGRSVDTTMGFTPLEGLVMSTRSGSVDPGALLWLQRSAGISSEDMERVLEMESGMLALSGTADMAEVMRRIEEGDERAGLAVDVYVHRLRGAIAAMAASMGGVDAIAFTGGVGEGSARIRSEACDGLRFLGVALDRAKNRPVTAEDADLSEDGAQVRVVLVHAREDLEIAAEVRRLLS